MRMRTHHVGATKPYHKCARAMPSTRLANGVISSRLRVMSGHGLGDAVHGFSGMQPRPLASFHRFRCTRSILPSLWQVAAGPLRDISRVSCCRTVVSDVCEPVWFPAIPPLLTTLTKLPRASITFRNGKPGYIPLPSTNAMAANTNSALQRRPCKVLS
jgi:hypothetical protein